MVVARRPGHPEGSLQGSGQQGAPGMQGGTAVQKVPGGYFFTFLYCSYLN